MAPRKYGCPACGEKAGVDIVYGMPGHDLAEAEKRGEIVLGRCCVDLAGPERQRRPGSSLTIQHFRSECSEECYLAGNAPELLGQ